MIEQLRPAGVSRAGGVAQRQHRVFHFVFAERFQHRAHRRSAAISDTSELQAEIANLHLPGQDRRECRHDGRAGNAAGLFEIGLLQLDECLQVLL